VLTTLSPSIFVYNFITSIPKVFYFPPNHSLVYINMSEEPPQIDLPPTMDDDMPPSDDEAEEPTVDIEEEDLQNFWSAQSAPEYNPEYNLIEEGPVKIQRIEDVSKEPVQLPEGIEWCTVDPLKGDELDELWELLNRQYVEDEDSMFRFDYSKTMLKWSVVSFDITPRTHQN